MGIHGMMKLIGDYAPSAMKDNEIKSYFGELRVYSMRSLARVEIWLKRLPKLYYRPCNDMV